MSGTNKKVARSMTGTPIQESGHPPRDGKGCEQARYDSNQDEPGSIVNRAQYFSREGADTTQMPISHARETECGPDADGGQKRYNQDGTKT